MLKYEVKSDSNQSLKLNYQKKTILNSVNPNLMK